MNDEQKRIGVLVGGVGAERDQSVRAGEAVAEALRQRGHEASLLFVDREVDLALRQSQIDIAFLALRGRYGMDGCLQGLLELLGVPYTGSGVLASSLASSRAKTKEVLRLHNLPTAPSYVLRADAADEVLTAHGSFGFPVLVRPLVTTTLLGGAVAHDELEFEAAVDDAFRVGDEVIVERIVEGRSVQVAVVDGVALGALEFPRPVAGGRPSRVAGPAPATPVRISAARYRSLLRLATQAYEALGCEGAALVDMTVSERLNEVIVDIDAAPMLTPSGPLARIAAGAGMKFVDLVSELLEGARVRAHGRRGNRRAVQVTFEGPDRRAAAAVAH